jgi:hypothetical protein
MDLEDKDTIAVVVIPMKQALPKLVYFGCTSEEGCWVGSSFSREPLVLMLILKIIIIIIIGSPGVGLSLILKNLKPCGFNFDTFFSNSRIFEAWFEN